MPSPSEPDYISATERVRGLRQAGQRAARDLLALTRAPALDLTADERRAVLTAAGIATEVAEGDRRVL